LPIGDALAVDSPAQQSITSMIVSTAVHCSEALFFGVYVAFRAIGSAAKIVDDPVTKPKHCRTL
jgi:hypothetical protein